MTRPRYRLDHVLCKRGFFGSRSRAAAAVMAGRVWVGQRRQNKAGISISGDAQIRVEPDVIEFVSRGGIKLNGALDEWGVDVREMVGMDIGASTGGFTDCLLQHGARKVIAIDVGYGQLAWKLRTDPRVVVIERCNARYLTADWLGQQDGYEPPAIVVMDVSFISILKILPAVLGVLHSDGGVITLVKPQFEAPRESVGRGGIVRDSVVHEQVLNDVSSKIKQMGFSIMGCCRSTLAGADGNQEFFLYLKK